MLTMFICSLINFVFSMCGALGVVLKNYQISKISFLNCCSGFAIFIMMIIGADWRWSMSGKICSGEGLKDKTGAVNYALETGNLMNIVLII